jgi:hypothetical protein
MALGQDAIELFLLVVQVVAAFFYESFCLVDLLFLLLDAFLSFFNLFLADLDLQLL